MNWKCTFLRSFLVVAACLLLSCFSGFSQRDTLLYEPLTTTLGRFTPLSVSGAQVWASSSYGAKMSGYANSIYNENEDWLISPPLDLTGKTRVKLSFQHAHRYAAYPSQELVLLVSDTYKEGMLDSVTWRRLNFAYSDQTTWSMVYVDTLSLDAYANRSNVRFAFRYRSSSSSAATWEIKNVFVESLKTNPVPPVDEPKDTVPNPPADTTNTSNVIFSENFNGFTNGSLVSPFGTNVSTQLNTYTQMPGWQGRYVYQAGGAIKCGSSSQPGMISTPPVFLKGDEGTVSLSFKSMPWTGDSTSINILLNGSPLHRVKLKPNTGANVMSSYGPFVLPAGMTSNTVTLVSDSVFRGYRFYLDDLIITSSKVDSVPPIPAVVAMDPVTCRGFIDSVYFYNTYLKGSRLQGDLHLSIRSAKNSFFVSDTAFTAESVMEGKQFKIIYQPTSTGEDTAYITVTGGGLLEPYVATVYAFAENKPQFQVVTVPNLAALRAAYALNPNDHTTVYRVAGQVVVSYTHSQGNIKYFQDPSGGIMVYDVKGMIQPLDRNQGVVRLTGTLSEYGGVLQLIPVENVYLMTSINTLTPMRMTIAQYKANREFYESRLIEIDSLAYMQSSSVWSYTKANYPFTDGKDTLIIRTNFTGLDYMGDSIPRKAHFTGLALEYNGTPQLFPRDAADIDAPTVVEDTLCTSLRLTGGTAYTGEPIRLNLELQNLQPQKNVIAYQFDLYYDPFHLSYQNVEQSGTLSQGGVVYVNDSIPGMLRVSYMSTIPLQQNGTLLHVVFNPLKAGTTLPILTGFLLNTEEIPALETDFILITERNQILPGDVDGNSLVQAYDAALTLQYSVGMDPLPFTDPLPWDTTRMLAADVDGVGGVTAYDAALILKYSAKSIFDFPPLDSLLVKFGADNVDVTVEQVGDNLLFKSTGNLIGLNLTMSDNNRALGTPVVLDPSVLSAVNQSDGTYAVGLAGSKSFSGDSAFLSIPINPDQDADLTINLVMNTTNKTLSTKVATGMYKNKLSALKVYPNPVVGTLTVEGVSAGTVCRLYDVRGVLMSGKTMEGTDNQIDVSSLPEGMYMMNVVAADGSRKVVKVVKQ